MSFNDLLKEIDITIEGCNFPLFRGHTNTSYTLTPGLFRGAKRKGSDEGNMHIDFTTYGSYFIDPHVTSELENLFLMQHSGMPTRLLDWTSNFAVALYFALRKPERGNLPCVWALNPHHLNHESTSGEEIPDISCIDYDSESGKIKYKFPNGKKMTIKSPIAVISPMRTQRILAQKGYFTIHGKNDKPIEILCPQCVRKFEVQSEMIDDANLFLKYAGVNEYSVYPDLDGLARHLRNEYKY